MVLFNLVSEQWIIKIVHVYANVKHLNKWRLIGLVSVQPNAKLVFYLIQEDRLLSALVLLYDVELPEHESYESPIQ